ncbi:MAG: hypothetical protein LBQ93_08940 [Treponema sp.]|jgi:heme exporter protein D|nr:hypothetical protein [Treponema sp.]
MKKFLSLFLALLLPLASVFAAGAAGVSSDPILIGIMEAEHVQTALRYLQQVEEWKNTAQHMVQEVQQWKFQIDAYVQNIKSAKDIRSYDDFMSWFNRTLHTEKKTLEMAENANILIGNKTYSLYDLEGIIDAVDDRYIKQWDSEFTEEQRRAIWTRMGLTPSNYAYMQTFGKKLRDMSREDFFASEIQNEWYTRNMERNNERQERLAQDKNFSSDDPRKMGELEALQLMVESSMENNKVLNDLAVMQARQMELQATEYYLNQGRQDRPALSDNSWGDIFKPIEYDTKH